MGGGAISYLGALSDLLLRAEVTDGEGAALSLEEGAARAVEMILSVGTPGGEGQGSAPGKVMLVGNGGSASIASHMQNDLCAAAGVQAMVFHEPPLLTALANDHGYASAFERLAELWARPGDLVLAVSSSGGSENILRAVRASKSRGCRALTFSGFRPDNPLRGMGDVNFYVPSESYGYVEVAHMALGHFLTDLAAAARPTREERP